MSAQPSKMLAIIHWGTVVPLEALAVECVLYVLTCENTDVVAQNNKSNDRF